MTAPLSDFKATLDALAASDSGRRLVVTQIKNGQLIWSLVDLRPTGQATTAALSTGGQTWVADVPVHAAHRLVSASSAAALARAARVRVRAQPSAYQSPAEDGQAGERDRPLDDSARGHAVLVAEALRGMSLPASWECTNCCGCGGFDVDCRCGDAGQVRYLGLLDPEGTLTGTDPLAEKDGPADPDCVGCGGSGRRWAVCVCCGGAGRIAGRPALELVEPVSGRRERVVFDAAALVAGGCSIEARVTSYPTWGEVRFSLALRAYLAGVLARLGASYDSHLPQRDGHVSMWEVCWSDPAWTLRYDRTAGPDRARWRFAYPADHEASGGVVVSSDRVADGLGPPEQIAAALARATSSLLGQLAGSSADEDWMVIGSDGLVVTRRVVLRAHDDLEGVAADLAAAAAGSGRAVAFGLGFIATGQDGPSVYLTETDGSPVEELACDYRWAPALLNARDKLTTRQ